MIKSMTGFGVGTAETTDYRLHAEVKSVNQRYLDIEIRAPHSLDPYLDLIRKKIREYASRGKMSVFIQFTDKREGAASIRVDKNLAIAYQRALNEISDALHVTRADDVLTIASYKGVLSEAETGEGFPGIEPVLLDALDGAMKKFTEGAIIEGENIKKDFLKRLAVLEDYTERIEGYGPEIVQKYRERLEKTITEILKTTPPDENRLIQETAIYADRVNYTEEIVRLKSHFSQFRKIIEDASEPVGRKLDFLLQEMNREINTTASKANDTAAISLVVDAKSEIEKIREQVQNIE